MKAVLETSHLLLRPWQEDDLDPLVRLLARLEVARYIRLDGQVFTGDETAEIHQRIMRVWHEQGLGPWAVIDKSIGSCSALATTTPLVIPCAPAGRESGRR
jgi:RimJ/RimL family protein N-acetyltransferase